MSKPFANPTRLSSLPESEDALGVGRLFRNGRELPDEDLPTLHWRLRTSQRLRAIRPRRLLKVALVVGIVFCTGGVVGAAVWRFWARKEMVAVVSPTLPVAPSTRHRKPRQLTSAPATPTLLEAVPAEIEPAAQEPRPMPDALKSVPARAKHRAAVRVAILNAPTPPPAPSTAPEPALERVAPSAIAVEQALLGQAVRMLRDGHDARTALALLAEHAERFPKGALAAEGTIVRIEALLALGRRDEALSVLDTAPLASLPNGDEQLVVRGELRAANRRWREAKQDFDEALKAPGLSATSAKVRNIQERALWGRAFARSRLGDQDGARTDLDLYLRHFPGGRFAGPAASLLKGVP
jgi:TolA-binding protein